MDIDECSSQIHDCSQGERCINTVGSWKCCLPGYQLGDDGETCTDIDECQSGPDSVCPQGQSCFNTLGSHVCCDAGYTMAEDNLTCVDIDECQDLAICPDKNKECLNTEGSFSCICIPSSYDEDGRGDCQCNQGGKDRVCESCDEGAVLVREKYRTFCKNQITECDIYQQDKRASSTVERLKKFPNYDLVTRGYNILRGEMLGLTDGKDPGFTNSHIFSVVRKDHLGEKCSFKGYISDTAKNCQGSSTSVVFTNSSDILNSLAVDDISRQIITGGEVTFEESQNAQHSNSFSFGADVSVSRGSRDSVGNDACVDRGLASTVQVGETLEKNGQRTRENTVGTSTESEFSIGTSNSIGTENSLVSDSTLSVGSEVAGGLLKSALKGTSSLTTNSALTTNNRFSSKFETQQKDITSNGWSEVNSKTETSQRKIDTKFCEDFNSEESFDQKEGNSTTQGGGSSRGRKVTKGFKQPGYLDSVRNSASISLAEKHFSKYSGAIAVSSRKCSSYEMGIQADNPPTFTDEFKASVQDLHDLSVETRSHRLIVVKTGERQFNTTLNSTTEGKFDSAFITFIR